MSESDIICECGSTVYSYAIRGEALWLICGLCHSPIVCVDREFFGSDEEPESDQYNEYGHYRCACGYTSCGSRGCGHCADCMGEICECHIPQI